MLTYPTLKKKPKEWLALTGLARREFDKLLPVFVQVLTAAETPTKPKRKKRQRAVGGGRKPGLGSADRSNCQPERPSVGHHRAIVLPFAKGRPVKG